MGIQDVECFFFFTGVQILLALFSGCSQVFAASLGAWMAERSKVVDLGSIIVRCVGSNSTPGSKFSCDVFFCER